MEWLDGYAAFLDAAADVHQTAAITGGENVCAPVSEAKVELIVQHCSGDLGVFYGEGTAEAAADLGLLHFDQLNAGERVEQGARLGENAEFASEVAAFVVGYFSCRFGRIGVGELAEVGDAEDIHDEFGQLEGAARKGRDPVLHRRFVVEEFGVEDAHHAGA